MGAQVTGMVAATDLETTAAYEGCGQVTRKRKITDKHGNVREMEVTVYGWKPIVMIDARTKIPLAVTVVPIHEHEVRSMRALVTQARTNLAGFTQLHQVVFDRGFWAGAGLGWLDQHGITLVVLAKDHMAVTVDARRKRLRARASRWAVGCIQSATGRGKPLGPNGGRLRSGASQP
jgi:hypothetical protein